MDNYTLDYRDYLQSDEWKKRAKQRLQIDGFSCQVCGCNGTKDNPLEVHHLNYKNKGNEDVYKDLVTLCRSCHEKIHKMMNRVTSRDGARGWKTERYVPNVFTFNVSGTETEIYIK